VRPRSRRDHGSRRPAYGGLPSILLESDAMRFAAAALGLVLGFSGLAACEREQKAVQQDLPAARATRARADVQQIAAAVRLYRATFGALPVSLEVLTQAQTSGGTRGGPFLASVPAPPVGWTPYRYARQGTDGFTVSSSGGGVTVTAPE
jgi:type II secretion system (T2SS) protein G